MSKRTLILLIAILILTLILLPISLNFLVFWESGYSNGSMSDWFTLYSGIISGLIGGLITFLGVKLTIKNNNEIEVKKNKPNLDVLDNKLLIGGAHLPEQKTPIIIDIHNIGGSLAKNIEATISFSHFDELVKSAAEIYKDQDIKPGQIEVTSRTKNNGGKYARIFFQNLSYNYKYIDVLYGTLQDSYFRLIGNCVPIVLNYKSKVELEVPSDLSGWITFFSAYGNSEFDYNLFTMTLRLKYLSIENEEFTKNFQLKFIPTLETEVEDGMIKKLFVLRAYES